MQIYPLSTLSYFKKPEKSEETTHSAVADQNPHVKNYRQSLQQFKQYMLSIQPKVSMPSKKQMLFIPPALAVTSVPILLKARKPKAPAPTSSKYRPRKLLTGLGGAVGGLAGMGLLWVKGKPAVIAPPKSNFLNGNFIDSSTKVAKTAFPILGTAKIVSDSIFPPTRTTVHNTVPQQGWSTWLTPLALLGFIFWGRGFLADQRTLTAEMARDVCRHRGLVEQLTELLNKQKSLYTDLHNLYQEQGAIQLLQLMWTFGGGR